MKELSQKRKERSIIIPNNTHLCKHLTPFSLNKQIQDAEKELMNAFYKYTDSLFYIHGME